jgi:hypothetical protein
LACDRQFLPAGGDHLAFLEHVHQFDAAQGTASRAEGLETEHGFNDPFNRPMILFHSRLFLRFSLLKPRAESWMGSQLFEGLRLVR